MARIRRIRVIRGSNERENPLAKETYMHSIPRRWLPAFGLLSLAFAAPNAASAACCYFSAKNADILQPAQKVFISYDPAEKIETFTVQPKFEGNALDFGMVIP